MQSEYLVSIEPKAFALLERASREEHRDKSEIVSDLIKRHSLLRRMKEMENEIEPLMQAAGYDSEEDIFRDVS